MFIDFLKNYIPDYISCCIDDYELTEEEIEDIAHSVGNNEQLWECIDEAICWEVQLIQNEKSKKSE